MTTQNVAPAGQSFIERLARETKKEIAGQNTTIKAVGEAMGLNFEKLSRRLRGFVPFPVDEVATMCIVLKVPMVELMKRVEKA